MHDSKRDVANLLHEDAEARSIRERLRQKQQQQARQEQSHRRRVRERERYRQLKAGERTIGEVFSRTCACCGKSFETKQYNAVYCSLACQKEYYRKQAAAKHPGECICEICGTPFPASRGNLK